MVKRKVMDDVQQPKSKKKKVSVSSSEKTGKMDMSSPTSVFESLLGDIKVKKFFDDHWEKKPLACQRKDPTYFGELFSLSAMKEVLKDNELLYLADFNVCRYKNGEREDLNGEGRITEKDVEKFIKDKATIQFYHPQRYIDDFWNMLEKLETYFSCLVDSHIYFTPAGAEAFPPRCEEVEVFVLQLEGKSEWKLYEPLVELTRDDSEVSLEENIGKPMMEVTLEPGDLLYFSRGVIYQNKTSGKEPSTHISLSTYQENTWGDFMNHALTQAVETALENDVTIRCGLPREYFSLMGTGKNLSEYIEDDDDEDNKKKKKYSNLQHAKVQEFKKSLEKHISKLVNHIDVNSATDSMCKHFMANRLPPFGFEWKSEEEKDEKEEVIPDIKDAIKIRFPEHLRIVYVEEDDDVSDNEQDDNDEDDDSEMEKEMREEDKKLSAKSKSEKKKKTVTTPVKNEEKKGKKSSGKNKNESEGEEEMEDDDDDEDDENLENGPHIRIVHTLENNRFVHMGPEAFDDPGYLKLDLRFSDAVVELLNANDFITIKDILMEDDELKIELATVLLGNELVELRKGK